MKPLPYDAAYQKACSLTAELTLEEKLGLLSTHQNAVPRLGIPEFFIGTEVARGFVGRSPDKPSTVFPQPTGLAATFDKELMTLLGEIAGREARAYYNADKRGGLCLWGPTVDMVRDPRWGRTEEAYGEDPCLTGELSAAYTLGMAGESGGDLMTVPTLKHFCANNNEEDRGSCKTYLPLRLKYEYYYAAFERALRFGGARSVMAAYNEINGVPGIMNPELKSILQEQWGMWFTVSDGGDFTQNVTAHGYCETLSESYALCVRAGGDIMTDAEDAVSEAARRALEQGLITEEDIDVPVVATLYARIRLGNIGGNAYDGIGPEVIDCEAHREVNRRAAREQIVLLKNDGALPVRGTPEKIAVLGPLADESLMDWYTGYSNRQCTVLEGIRREFPESLVLHDSLWDRIALLCPNGKYLSAKEDGTLRADAEEITPAETFELQDWGENWQNLFSVKYGRYVRLFDDGSIRLHNRRIFDWFTRETFNLFDLDGKLLIEEFLNHGRLSCDGEGRLSIAKKRSVQEDMIFRRVIVSRGEERIDELTEGSGLTLYCVGNYPVQTAKECYDRRTLALNIQQGMAMKLAMHDPKTVLALISSYPYSFAAGEEYCGAILYSSHAGEFLGDAVAGTVSGRYNPAGRLPLTWYRSELELPDIKNYDIEHSGATYMYFTGEPLAEFGYGLSYSDFEYGELALSEAPEGILAELSVTNTSDTDGEEVVQIYFTLPESAVSRPNLKLCAFERVLIPAGETMSVALSVPRDILRIFDVRSGKMIVEAGDYRFMAGASSQDIRQEGNIFLSGEAVGRRPDSFGAEGFEEGRNVNIFCSKGLQKSYIRCCGWNGEAVYGGLDTEGKTKLVIRASSLLGARELAVRLGDTEQKLTLAPSDSYDDFKEYELDITGIRADTLSLMMQDSCGVLDVSIR
ncbi:MAG: glycoside hydrolase family 3 C-terminal domain-containing protein [Ruminococcus sp.]|nr:glycoside hydrolase family 3 C-terminal domain-containing protein [Ruminococcus sp.]